jgi:hypothetical protein
MSFHLMRKHSNPQQRLGIQIRVDTGSQTPVVVCMRPDQEIGGKLSLVCVGLCGQGRPQLHYMGRYKRLQCATLTLDFAIPSSLVQISF